jgi:hypothetical protein
MDDELQQRRTEQILRIAEDDLRARVMEISPQIARSVELEADMIRELVELERQKAGLDKTGGTIHLYPYKEKNDPAEPDIVGSARISGCSYRAAGWLTKNGGLRIALVPGKRQ